MNANYSLGVNKSPKCAVNDYNQRQCKKNRLVELLIGS